jgi:hypothetical protein
VAGCAASGTFNFSHATDLTDGDQIYLDSLFISPDCFFFKWNENEHNALHIYSEHLVHFEASVDTNCEREACSSARAKGPNELAAVTKYRCSDAGSDVTLSNKNALEPFH